ncbi:MAG TPA: hypothetical protein VFF68_10500 [Anaerolineaceae bacterium]|nr:hypothetical protein [Anaerolineaceae bacterium]
MDHVVYLDRKAGELEKLLAGEKTMIVRGAAGRKLPYGRVNAGDELYFVENNGDGLVRARACVKDVVLSDRLEPDDSRRLLASHQDKLQLTPAQVERWGGKRYLVLVEIEELQVVDPFRIDRSAYGNMDDWLPVEDIQSVR